MIPQRIVEFASLLPMVSVQMEAAKSVLLMFALLLNPKTIKVGIRMKMYNKRKSALAWWLKQTNTSEKRR
jgi:hypothetical protein